jgi:hypothetical protein
VVVVGAVRLVSLAVAADDAPAVDSITGGVGTHAVARAYVLRQISPRTSVEPALRVAVHTRVHTCDSQPLAMLESQRSTRSRSACPSSFTSNALVLTHASSFVLLSKGVSLTSRIVGSRCVAGPIANTSVAGSGIVMSSETRGPTQSSHSARERPPTRAWRKNPLELTRATHWLRGNAGETPIAVISDGDQPTCATYNADGSIARGVALVAGPHEATSTAAPSTRKRIRFRLYEDLW